MFSWDGSVVLIGGAEDMFGADDADWAIYRKIVSTLYRSSLEEIDSSLTLS